ncbi:hypothetical protein DFH29DRAFT_818224 [Suillus ampliporus]|nr:hypothetical protein DFH29DRAFT_818224 [Suillus ampliporus]
MDVLEDDTDEEEQLLQELVKGTKKDNEYTIAKQGEGNPEDTDIDNIKGWVDESTNLMAHEQEELHNNLQPVKLMLVKLHKLAFRIVHLSILLLPAWKALLEDLELKLCVMPWDVLTQWNSTFNMLDFTIKYWQALDDFTGDRKFGLCNFELSKKEWKIATQLHDTLTLDRYCSLTNSSQTYHIAMVLHPHHKLNYFKTAGWEPEWIQTASDLVHHEFDFAYADMPTSSADKESVYGEHESQVQKVHLILFNHDHY